MKFALYGAENVDPWKLDRARFPARAGAAVIRATLDTEIISAPCLHGHAEVEYVVDPRGILEYTTDTLDDGGVA